MSAGLLPDTSVDSLVPDGLPLLGSAAAVSAPKVNLLPPEIAARRTARKIAAALAGVVVLCAAGVGGGYVYAGSGEAEARSDLAAAQATQTGLQRQQRALAPAQEAQTKMQAAQAALAAAMGNEVLWSRYLDELRLKRPEGVRFSSVQIAPTTSSTSTGSTAGSGPATSGGATTGAAATGGIATLTLQGKARTQPDVAALLDVLAKVKGFSGVYLTSTDADSTTGVVTFAVTSSVTSEALSNRYIGGAS